MTQNINEYLWGDLKVGLSSSFPVKVTEEMITGDSWKNDYFIHLNLWFLAWYFGLGIFHMLVGLQVNWSNTQEYPIQYIKNGLEKHCLVFSPWQWYAQFLLGF